MKNVRPLLIAIFSIFLIINIEAKTINLEEAQQVAKNFMYITSATYNQAIPVETIKLTDPYIYRNGNVPVFYAFQMNPGFIIVSAEDAYQPILGYSFEGTFLYDGAPDHYRLFMDNYVKQINYVRDQQIAPGQEIIDNWKELRSNDITTMTITRDRDVAPLLACHWDQGSPYNIYCPEDAAGPGGHVWVGCVATAMAQIMYYWRYPETGTGQHCYIPGNSSYGQQCANYGATTYDWGSMINGVDNRFPEANALLQYHLAVSVNMDFGPDGSGSQSSLVPGRLNQYWRYNNAVYEERGDFSYTSWVNLLKADIDQGKPLYYSGYTDDWSGHAFVCDGYQGENFHFNFGWSGSSNGYYSLYDVGGFSNWQACVRNFAPSDNSYPYYCAGTKTLTQRSGSITDGSGPVNNYQNNSTAYWIIDPQTIYDSITSITLTFSAFDLAEGDTVKVYNGATTGDQLLGAYSGTAMPPAMTTTQNRMLIEFKTNGSGNSKGFYAEFTSLSPTWCQGLHQLTDPSGTFDDGSGDFYYQSQATCMWRINPPFANKIILNFNYFETEEGVDKVTVYDGTSKIAEFSGNQVPEPVEATSGMMFITWNTNASGNFQGWEAYYEVDNVGIDEGSAIKGLQVYPNPAADVVHISFAVEQRQTIQINLVNLTGQTVKSILLASFEGDFNEDIQLDGIPSGVYSLRINALNGIITKKVVIR